MVGITWGARVGAKGGRLGSSVVVPVRLQPSKGVGVSGACSRGSCQSPKTWDEERGS